MVETRVTALALALGLALTSCVPVIANLSKGDSVPTVIVAHAPQGSKILVLPLWLDTRAYNFHDPYVIPTSAIGTSAANVPRRMGFYFDSFVCGGPSTFVIGYLVVLESGTVIWSDVRGENESTSRALKAELKTLVSGGKAGPGLTELMQYGTIEIGLDADKGERAAALRFLERIPDEG